MSEIIFKTDFGEVELQRIPARKRELLRAWDAADEYLLEALADQNQTCNTVLIVNDAFGALAVSLSHLSPTSWSDSAVAHEATQKNLQRNGRDPSCVRQLPSTHSPQDGLGLVLIKVPKTLALLEDQLIKLKPLLKKDTRVIIAGMVKTMPASLWKILERYIGPTKTSRARKKARLIEVSVDTHIQLPSNPYPVSWQLAEPLLQVTNHANVFSRDRLDIGTRFMLQHLPETSGAVDIIDLGCGNGLLGLVAVLQNRQANIHFVDESYMAIDSARENLRQLEPQPAQASFHTCDGLTGFEADSTDLVLCNPPFHQSHQVGDTIALSMFKQSATVLRIGGSLWVVGNRHLGYHHKLKRWFGSVELVASNRKFVILKATKL